MTNFTRAISFLQLRWIGRERVVAYSAILFIVSLVSFYWPFQQATGKVGSDFLAFWSAGRLVVSGAANTVYDTAATFAVQAGLGRHDVFAFVNPPPFLFVIWPLGFLPYNLAWIVWVAATYLFWWRVSGRLDPTLTWPIAAFPGALVAGWHAQTGLLTSGFQGLAMNLLEKRPFLAGVFVGALVIKPHLAVLFPFAFVAGRQWRAFAGAAFSVVGLLLITWLVFGTGTMLDYRHSWSVSSYIMKTGDADFFLRQATVYAAVRVGMSSTWAVVAQAITTFVMILFTWRVWSGGGSTDGKLAFLMAATPLATPYLFNYDLPFLIIPIVWLIRQARIRPRGAWDRPILLFFYLSPLVGRALALPLGANLTPWIQIWMVWEIWVRIREEAQERARKPTI